MSKRLSVTLTCPPLPHQGLESFILGLLMKSTSQILRMPFKNPCHVPTGRRSQGSLIYMFGYADRRCLCSEDLRTFCGRVCFPLSATIIIQYISEKACCSPHKQTDVQLAEFVRVAALYTWSKKKKKNNKNGCSAKVVKRPNTAFLSHQLSWSDPLVANSMQNKPS